jgi:hypothetical protein
MQTVESRIEVAKNLDIFPYLPKVDTKLVDISYGINGSWADVRYKLGDPADFRVYHPNFLPRLIPKKIDGIDCKIWLSTISIDEKLMKEGVENLYAKTIRLVAELHPFYDFNGDISVLQQQASIYINNRPLNSSLHAEKKSLVRVEIEAALSELKQYSIFSKKPAQNIALYEKTKTITNEDLKGLRDSLPEIFCIIMNRWLPRKRLMNESLFKWNERFGQNYKELNFLSPTSAKYIKLLRESYLILDQMIRASLPM